MADLKQCKECNGTFQHTTNNNLCLSCSQKNELEFQRIKEYLKQHPKSSIGTIATILDIAVAHIQKFVDEDRLEIVQKNITSK